MNWKFWLRNKPRVDPPEGNLLFRLARARNNIYSIYLAFKGEDRNIEVDAMRLYATVLRAYKNEYKKMSKKGKGA